MFRKILLLAVLSIGVAVVAFAAMQWQRWHQAALPIADTTIISVEPGTSLGSLARQLADQGIIEHDLDLKILAKLEGNAGKIRAGEYQLQPGTTLAQLLEQMVRGDVLLHGLTVVDGMNFRQLKAVVDAHPALVHELRDADGAAIMAAIERNGMHPEGRFLPETYHFPRGMSDREFYRRAADSLDEVLEAAWAGRAEGLPYDNAYEALIMASIIEKETGIPEERTEIAGVFVRRLQKRMRLETDPTVIYGLGDEYTGDLTFADMRRDTPYNTYRRRGLPPTPIAMAGKAAIEAALHPAEGDTLFFVATGDGGHHFSSTLEEHNRMVRRYQMQRRPLESDSENGGG